MFDLTLATHLAELSKINFTDTELKKITDEMDEIINLFDTVSNFEDVENLSVNSAKNLDEIRQDVKKPSSPRKDILKNASKKSEKAFTVPKVV